MMRAVAALRQALDAPPDLSIPGAVKFMSELMRDGASVDVCEFFVQTVAFSLKTVAPLLPRFLFILVGNRGKSSLVFYDTRFL